MATKGGCASRGDASISIDSGSMRGLRPICIGSLAAVCFLLFGAGPALGARTVTYSAQWGGTGFGDGQFQNPGGIATDGAGNVYVADTENDRVQKFSPDGTFLAKWGSTGTGDGQFNRPEGITVSGAGSVYVTDALNDRVQEFTSGGVFVRKWGTTGTADGEFDLPWGVSTDATGNVYVTDVNNSRVQVFSSSGAFIRKWGATGAGHGEFDGARGVVVDGAGNVYVCDGNHDRVEVFTSTGSFFASIGTPTPGWDPIGCGSGIDLNQSSIFVTLGSSVEEFTRAGVYRGRVADSGSGNGQVSGPLDIATDAAGNLYVADNYNDRVQKFVPVVPPPPDPPPPAALSVVVDPNDTVSDADGCGGGTWTAADPCATIQAGVDAASVGGAVFVPGSSSPYAESVTVDTARLQIVGPFAGVAGYERPPGSLQEAQLLATGLPALRVTAPGVLVDGLTIAGAPGILFEAGGGLVRNNVFAGNSGAAVVPLEDTVITRNEFRATGPGSPFAAAIHSQDAANLQVTDNLFREQQVRAIDVGAGAAQDSGIVVDGNLSFGNSGFSLRNVAVSDVTNNFLFDLIPGGAGVLLDEVDDVVVYANAIVSSPVGIQLGQPAPGQGTAPIWNLSIAGNELLGNGSGSTISPTGGIYVTSRAQLDSVSVTMNRIVDNSSHANSSGIAADPGAGQPVSAENNWWGCNEGPGSPGCDEVAPSVDAAPWLRLSLEANPPQAPVPGTAELRAHFLQNSAGEFPPEIIDFPPVAIDLVHESGPGVLGETQLLTLEGAAGTTLSSDVAGTAVVRANVDFESAGAAVDFGGVTIPAAPASPSPSGVAPRTVRDTTSPAFRRALVVPAAFAVNRRGTAEVPLSARTPLGTSFRYTLSEAASVVFTIERRLVGRKTGGKCRAVTNRNRTRRRCTRYSVAGRFAAQSKAGPNRKAFSGRIGRKALKPGSYRATLVASDAAGNRSAPKRVAFRVVRR